MKYFIDTANVEEIRKAAELGIIDGVTTNPSLIAKEGRVFEEVIREITEIVDGPISAEVVSLDAEDMVKEADELVKIHENIVIKVPMTAEGLKATSMLSAKGIKVNVTLVFSATQALAAAKAGAAFVSPFVGRLDDIGAEGMELIEEIMYIFKSYGVRAEVIVASIRNRNHLTQAAMAGADIATIPYKVLMDSLKHPLTDQGIEKFLKDWEGAKK
ncbi:MAG: fructose-6-phosphate aldolase [Clostridia bacterium]|nr:fructose-6-phosphate aldolase [Clostridia bacterium]